MNIKIIKTYKIYLFNHYYNVIEYLLFEETITRRNYRYL